jgi:hypothetical protein
MEFEIIEYAYNLSTMQIGKMNSYVYADKKHAFTHRFVIFALLEI